MRIKPPENEVLMVRSSAAEYPGGISADTQLQEDSVIRKFRITAVDSKPQEVAVIRKFRITAAHGIVPCEREICL